MKISKLFLALLRLSGIAMACATTCGKNGERKYKNSCGVGTCEGPAEVADYNPIDERAVSTAIVHMAFVATAAIVSDFKLLETVLFLTKETLGLVGTGEENGEDPLAELRDEILAKTEVLIDEANLDQDISDFFSYVTDARKRLNLFNKYMTKRNTTEAEKELEFARYECDEFAFAVEEVLAGTNYADPRAPLEAIKEYCIICNTVGLAYKVQTGNQDPFDRYMKACTDDAEDLIPPAKMTRLAQIPDSCDSDWDSSKDNGCLNSWVFGGGYNKPGSYSAKDLGTDKVIVDWKNKGRCFKCLTSDNPVDVWKVGHLDDCDDILMDPCRKCVNDYKEKLEYNLDVQYRKNIGVPAATYRRMSDTSSFDYIALRGPNADRMPVCEVQAFAVDGSPVSLYVDNTLKATTDGDIRSCVLEESSFDTAWSAQFADIHAIGRIELTLHSSAFENDKSTLKSLFDNVEFVVKGKPNAVTTLAETKQGTQITIYPTFKLKGNQLYLRGSPQRSVEGHDEFYIDEDSQMCYGITESGAKQCFKDVVVANVADRYYTIRDTNSGMFYAIDFDGTPYETTHIGEGLANRARREFEFLPTGMVVIPQVEKNTSCKQDRDCSSNDCGDNGLCLLKAGDLCHDDSECQDGQCDEFYPGFPFLVPGVSGLRRCIGKALSECTHDHQCDSDICFYGICKDKPGSICASPNECTSGECTYGRCSKHEVGEPCRSDYGFKSLWCEDHCNTLLQTPVCDTKNAKAIGAMCENNDHCATGLTCGENKLCESDNATPQGVGEQILVLNDSKDMAPLQKAIAEKCGGNLASISSEEENDAVKSLLDRHGVKEAWIGGYSNTYKTENSWIWLDGSDFVFSNWYNAHWSKVTGEKYISVRSDDSGLQWFGKKGYPWMSAVYLLPVDYADREECTQQIEFKI